MKKINLAISGCLGRMGQQLIKSSKSNKNFKLVALTENKIINKKIAGIKLNLNTDQAFKNTDIIIDFTVPNCTLDILKIASKLKKRVVIGTTGFTQKEDDLIKRFSLFNAIKSISWIIFIAIKEMFCVKNKLSFIFDKVFCCFFNIC